MNSVSNILIELAVHQRHLKLILKIGQRPQPSDHRVAGLLLHVLHEQALENVHRDIGQPGGGLLNHGFSLGGGEQRLLAPVAGHGHHHTVKQTGRPLDDIQVAVG